MSKGLPAYVYGDLKREELHRTGSVVLHEHYFANLGGDDRPGGEVLDTIKEWFGSFEGWEAQFKKTANALGGGSGWARSPTTCTRAIVRSGGRLAGRRGSRTASRRGRENS